MRFRVDSEECCHTPSSDTHALMRVTSRVHLFHRCERLRTGSCHELVTFNFELQFSNRTFERFVFPSCFCAGWLQEMAHCQERRGKACPVWSISVSHVLLCFLLVPSHLMSDVSDVLSFKRSNELIVDSSIEAIQSSSTSLLSACFRFLAPVVRTASRRAKQYWQNIIE